MPAVATLDDLTAAMAEDPHGHRYEISPEGVLSVMPPPGYTHAIIATRIMLWLGAAIAADRIAQAIGLRIPGRDGREGGRIPDLVVWSRAQQEAVWLSAADVLLVIEIVSPGSKGADTVDKVGEYASAGIPQYWTVSQDGPQTVTMYRLVGDRYETAASMPLTWVLSTAVGEHLDLA
ncbi:Uma2 family endonuclease [Dactylosporangium vinaceum]|nr:Uma2 family endonuclease [Dactylosporangium vinaceum]